MDSSAPPAGPAGNLRRGRPAPSPAAPASGTARASACRRRKSAARVACPVLWSSLQLKQPDGIVVGDIGAHLVVEFFAVEPVSGLFGLLERIVGAEHDAVMA